MEVVRQDRIVETPGQGPTPPDSAGPPARLYRPPGLIVVGRAVDLIQSSSTGKYSDGYTGYYWER